MTRSGHTLPAFKVQWGYSAAAALPVEILSPAPLQPKSSLTADTATEEGRLRRACDGEPLTGPLAGA